MKREGSASRMMSINRQWGEDLGAPQMPSAWSWLQDLGGHLLIGSHFIWIFWVKAPLFKFAWMLSMQLNDSSLVHSLTSFPSPKENHRNHVTALTMLLLLLLLSCFSRVRLCATPETATHQAPPSLGFSRQEHWSGLPFPSPMHESEKWRWSRSVVSDS